MANKIDVDQLKKEIQAERVAQSFQELVNDMSEKCFTHCVKKPGTSLDSYEQRCLGNCMDRFIDSYNLVTKVFTEHLSANMNGRQFE